MAATMGFFIDTGGAGEELEEVEQKEEEEGEEEEDRVMGAKDAATEAKLRNRGKKERSLTSFLFGKAGEAPASSEENQSESESEPSDLASDLDSEEDNDDSEGEVDDGEKKLEDEINEEEEEETEPSCVQPSLLSSSDMFPGTAGPRKRKAAWVDTEDSAVRVKDVTATYKKAVGKHGSKETSTELYTKSVARKFKSVVGEPGWARLDRKEEEGSGDSDDEFFRETQEVVDRSPAGVLQPGRLALRKLKDVNYSTHKEGAVIRSTEFHPTSTVGMVAGNNGTVSLFQIDGKENPKLQTVNFSNFPIRTAKFSASGSELMAGSNNHPHYFVFDLMLGRTTKVPWGQNSGEHTSGNFDISPDGKLIAFVGRFGMLHLVSARSKELLHSFKANENISAVSFSRDSGAVYSTGGGGEVYCWDLRQLACRYKFPDSGAVAGTAVAASRDHLATGSDSGVVNIYRNRSLGGSGQAEPERAVLNLTTEIDSLTWNPAGELLVLSSIEKDGAVRILHTPSLTVYSNFPGQFGLSRVNCAAFSPAGGYLSLGNNKGAAHLYRIPHYNQY